jgi:8-oxo-dGTP pyrophosphatase MutT (NUDIX family)
MLSNVDIKANINLNPTILPEGSSSSSSIVKKFNLKHIFRGGAVVWTKYKQKDFYLVFRSNSRPQRGIQLPGGRIEREENPAEGILREVKEETGLSTKILCPLGLVYFENIKDNYSNLQIYYILKTLKPINPAQKWHYTDKDNSHQELECWFEPIEKDLGFLANGQNEVIEMFKKWLEDHKPGETLISNLTQN